MKRSVDINELIILAEQGDKKAQEKMGIFYYKGLHGVEQNYEKAVNYFIATNNKNMLGECYLHGLGVERNVEKTIELWEAACEEYWRYHEVMYKLAHLCGDGTKMEPNYDKEAYWWNKLACNDEGEFAEEGALAEAVYKVASYYYEGKGTRKNIKKALEIFKKAIDLFYIRKGEVFFTEIDKEKYEVKADIIKYEGEFPISKEPDFMINARRILVEHGNKTIINNLKEAAEKGDLKAAEILNEFKIVFTVAPTHAVIDESKQPILKKEVDHEEFFDIFVGQAVIHKTFGEGVVCEFNGRFFSVEFVSVGKKKFLNPRAFKEGFLKFIDNG